MGDLDAGVPPDRIRTFAKKSLRLPGEQANGNDVLAIYSKSGRPWTVPAGFPMVIETVSYHATDHNTSDSPAVYRDAP